MSTDRNDPAEGSEQPSESHRNIESIDPEMFAYTLISHLLDEHGEGKAESYLMRVVEELLELEPAVRQRLSALLLTDLKEELARRAPESSRAIIGLIEQVEANWGCNG